MLTLLRYAILLILLSPTLAFGQEQEAEKVIIAGVEVDADSVQVLPSVHLRVRNTSLGGVTGENGRFKTRVHPTDTLEFTRVGYQSTVLVPADSTSERLTQLVIRMQPQITMLEEVKVKEYIDITKYIRREYDTTVNMRRPKGAPLFEKQEPKEQKAVRLGSGTNGASLEGAVTAFANLFSSEFQQQKRVKELLAIEEAQSRQRAVREAMTERYQAMVLTVVDLPPEDLARFTTAYMPHPMTMASMSDYEVMETIVINLRKFDTQETLLRELLDKGTFEGEERHP